MTHAAQPPDRPAVIVSIGQIKTLLAALDEAADYKRDRAEACADCADQSCTTCQRRLQAADTYDHMAAQLIQAAETSAIRHAAPSQAAPARSGADPTADPEAGQ